MKIIDKNIFHGIYALYYDIATSKKRYRVQHSDHRATKATQISTSGDLILQMYDCVKSKAFPSVFQSLSEYTAIGKIHESCLFSNDNTIA